MRIEEIILSALANDEDFIQKAGPYLKSEYFSNESEKITYELLEQFIRKYNKKPSRDSVMVEFEDLSGLSEDEYKETKKLLKDAFADQYEYEFPWLIEQAEKFCQDKALYNAIMESVTVINGEHKTLERGSIPTLLTQALSIAFDSDLGHDYFEDAASRHEYYNEKSVRIPVEIQLLNRATGGGYPKKTLILYLAPSNVGKSAVMASDAAYWLAQGKNVAVFTMEMEEKLWSKRIDAHLMNMAMNDLDDMPKSSFLKKIDNLKAKTHGRLKVKEFPPNGASVLDFERVLDEWKLKEDFVPDVVVVDYLGIVSAATLKLGGSINTYYYLKRVAEEMRAMAVRRNVLVLSAVQTNRNGYDNTDINEKDFADSMGILHTADFVTALISTDELRELNQMIMKILKTRFGDKKITKFVVGFDFPKMKLFNVEQEGQIRGAKDDEPKQKFGGKKEGNERKFTGFNFDD